MTNTKILLLGAAAMIAWLAWKRSVGTIAT
jgi:hypothetical protein